jgi:hypothetical protein
MAALPPLSFRHMQESNSAAFLLSDKEDSIGTDSKQAFLL